MAAVFENLTAALFARRSRHARVALVLAAMVCVSLAGTPAGAQTPPTFTPSDESPEELPPGSGREETFYACTACHNFKLVAAQGMNRRQWEESLQLMIERHGMPELEANDRKLVLDYLEATYPPRGPAGTGGWQNPFLKR